MKTQGGLESKLSNGQFVVCAELGPPKGADAEEVRKNAAHYLGCGIDGVNITDNQTAVARMSALAAGKIVQEEGLEPIYQLTTRDRNRIALQSDVLGAAALGFHNILCLTGDHPSVGNHPDAKTVWDIDSLQLIEMVRRMRDEGVFLNGEEVEGRPRLLIGAAANPFAPPLDWRITRLEKKLLAGADFIQTQAIFDLERFNEWMEEVRAAGLHEQCYILAGIVPFTSLGALRYMKTQVPGMTVPDKYIDRMKKAENKREEALTICAELLQELSKIPGVAGVHIMPAGRERLVPRLVEMAGLGTASVPQ